MMENWLACELFLSYRLYSVVRATQHSLPFELGTYSILYPVLSMLISPQHRDNLTNIVKGHTAKRGRQTAA